MTAITIVGCASTPYSTRNVDPLPVVAAQDVFTKAVREVCFGALERNVSIALIAEEGGFERMTTDVSRFRTSPEEEFYSASFTSAPILISSLHDGEACSVTAVRGSYEELKGLSEIEIESFRSQYPDGEAPDHLAIVESDVQNRFILKFTLLSGDDLKNKEDGNGK